jgi:RIO kinase 2
VDGGDNIIMKLDIKVLRYLTKEDFRVLTAIEMGMRNHEIVPVELIIMIAGLKHGGAHRNLTTLLKHSLIHHDRQKYDGYRLTYQGYDFLAIKAMLNRRSLSGLGRKIGIGKESDVYLAINDETGEQMALKIHRLGRTSFTNVRNLRDYVGNKKGGSWLYLSRLAAHKEMAFMKVLHANNFPVPVPVDHSRHCVLMSLVTGLPFTQVGELGHPEKVYTDCTNVLLRLARCGLIHGDFNEFNFIIDEKEKITMIDFPQMVSTTHRNARMYFDRDAAGIHHFFSHKLGYTEAQLVNWDDIGLRESNLDEDVRASGFSEKDRKDFEQLVSAQSQGGEEMAGEAFAAEDEDNEAAMGDDDAKVPGMVSGEVVSGKVSLSEEHSVEEGTSFLDVVSMSMNHGASTAVADEKIKSRVKANLSRKMKRGGSRKLGGGNKNKGKELRRNKQCVKYST